MARFRNHGLAAGLSVAAMIAAWSAPASASKISVIVENLAPADGVFLTPFGVFFHDGTFNIGTVGQPASAELERAAEDGNLAPLFAAYDASGSGTARAAIDSPNGPVFPGNTGRFEFDVDPTKDRYVSFVSMVIPSNDAFIANGNPVAHPLFNGSGEFQPFEIVIGGEHVYDAGTEVNDEIPTNTAALNQAGPNTGVDENGVIALHPGFMAGGNVLARIPEGDFTQPGYEVAKFSVVPIPAALPLMAGGLGLLAVLARRRKIAQTA